MWLLIPAAVLLLMLAPRMVFQQRSEARILPVDELEGIPTAIVFGAGLTRSGRPTRVLADRIQTGIDLYTSGIVDVLIMSGSAEGPDYDEPGAMRTYALQQGVPEAAILMDRDGSRTYQTCLRARDFFGLDRAVLVTQRYHLPRALAICEGLGLDTYGVAADRSMYRALGFWNLREIPAAWVALWDLHGLTSRLPLN